MVEWTPSMRQGRPGVRSIPTGSCFSNANDAVPVHFFLNGSAEFRDAYTPMFLPLPSVHDFSVSYTRKLPWRNYYRPYMLHIVNGFMDWSVIPGSDEAIVRIQGSVVYISLGRATQDILAAVVVRDVNYPDLFWYREKTKIHDRYDLPAISPSLLEFWYSSTLATPIQGTMGRVRRAFLTLMLPYFKTTGMRIEIKSPDEMQSLVYQPKTSFRSLEEIGEWKSKTMWKIYDNYGHTQLDGAAPQIGATGSIPGIPNVLTSH